MASYFLPGPLDSSEHLWYTNVPNTLPDPKFIRRGAAAGIIRSFPAQFKFGAASSRVGWRCALVWETHMPKSHFLSANIEENRQEVKNEKSRTLGLPVGA
jgi:hypothetical protein